MNPVGQLFVMSLIFNCFFMTAVWFWARRINNYSIVDSAWAYAFSASLFLVLLLTNGEGWGSRRAVLISIVGFWSLRLGTYLAYRIYSHHPLEDSRYATLRAEYGHKFPARFFHFFQLQAVTVAILSLPFLHIALNPAPEFSVYEYLGTGLWAVALLGESLADRQLNRFKMDTHNRGQVCQNGLWRYSRHPNYFFESLVWWGFYLFALGTPGAWYTIYCPLVMLFLLLKVTGVPVAEAQALKSRGEEYRAYQRKTSAFVPWFPRRG